MSTVAATEDSFFIQFRASYRTVSAQENIPSVVLGSAKDSLMTLYHARLQNMSEQ